MKKLFLFIIFILFNTIIFASGVAPSAVQIKNSDNEIAGINNGGLDTNVQDQTTDALDLYFLKQKAITTLSADAVIDANTIQVTSATGFTVGDYVGIFATGVAEDRFYFAEILTVVSTTLTLDTPLDFAFGSGSIIVSQTRDLDVNGASTSQTYQITVGGNLSLEITRLIFAITTSSAVDLDKFGNIGGGLTKGIVLRINDGIKKNIVNIKTNRDLANLAYDYTTFAATNPQQGVDGLVVRYSFAGQDKHGVVIKLSPGDSLELIIQDDLSSLSSFRMIAQGHVEPIN